MHQVQGSILTEVLQKDFPGVSVSWLLLASAGSLFALHVEDALLGSLNYLHEGHAKENTL